MVSRERFVGVKFTAVEYEHVAEMAAADRDTRYKKGRKNLSAYIRKCVLQQSGFDKELHVRKELNRLTYQIRKIGVNVNQAVKKINSGFYDAETTEKLISGLDQVNLNIDELIDKLEEIKNWQ